MPPRARFVGRTGMVVLNLDHYCTFLGLPIGHANRSHFLQFLAWATILCLAGALTCVVELVRSEAVANVLNMWHSLRSISPERGVRTITYPDKVDFRVVLLVYTMIADVLAAGGLGTLGLWQFDLAMKGRVTVAPSDDTHDLGSARRNLQCVLG